MGLPIKKSAPLAVPDSFGLVSGSMGLFGLRVTTGGFGFWSVAESGFGFDEDRARMATVSRLTAPTRAAANKSFFGD